MSKYYINPADIDEPPVYFYVEDEDGQAGEESYDVEAQAISAALAESATFSDVYRVYRNDGRIVALVLDGVVYMRQAI